MIVDDDPGFLVTAEKLLGECEMVYFARNARDAKELMQSIGAEISAAFIDLDLHGEDGFTLISEMRKCFPDLPLIAISGVSQKHVLDSAKLLGAAASLKKPITKEWMTELARVRTKTAGA